MNALLLNILAGVSTAIVLAVGVQMLRYMGRMNRAVEAVEEHLKVNGHEGMLPEEMRGMPLRTLVILGIAQQMKHANNPRAHTALHVVQPTEGG